MYVIVMCMEVIIMCVEMIMDAFRFTETIVKSVGWLGVIQFILNIIIISIVRLARMLMFE